MVGKSSATLNPDLNILYYLWFNRIGVFRFIYTVNRNNITDTELHESMPLRSFLRLIEIKVFALKLSTCKCCLFVLIDTEFDYFSCRSKEIVNHAAGWRIWNACQDSSSTALRNSQQSNFCGVNQNMILDYRHRVPVQVEVDVLEFKQILCRIIWDNLILGTSLSKESFFGEIFVEYLLS